MAGNHQLWRTDHQLRPQVSDLRLHTVKVLVINTSGENSGAEFSLLTMLQQKPGRELTFCLATPPNSLLEKQVGTPTLVRTFDLVKIIRPTGIKNSLNTIRRWFSSFRALRHWAKQEQIDLIYANNLKAVTYGIALKLVLSKKLVLHSRDNATQWWVRTISAFFADRILCISAYIENQYKGKEHKTMRAYPLVQLKALEEKEPLPDLRAQLGIDPNQLLVAQIAQLAPWKNHRLFLEMATRLKKENVHFLIIGAPLCLKDQAYKQQLQAEAVQLGLQDRVSFPGFLPNIAAVLQQIDLLVHPVANEPFGRVMLEAQLAGLPVVSIKAGGASEIITDSSTGFLIDSLSAHELAEKTRMLLHNEPLRKQMGMAAKKQARCKFAIETHSQQLFEHLSQW